MALKLGEKTCATNCGAMVGVVGCLTLRVMKETGPLTTYRIQSQDKYEPKMVAHICFMFRIYLELHLKSLLKRLKIFKKMRLSVELCFRP